MYDEKILLISELDINTILTQRPNHLLRFIKANFKISSMISFDNQVKLSKDFWNNSYKEFNQKYSKDGNFEYYGIPQSNYHDKLKRIFIERKIMEKYLIHNFTNKKFDICIICHPFSASLIPILKEFSIASKVIYEDLDDFVDYFCSEDYEFKTIISKFEKYAIENSDVVFSISRRLREFRISSNIYNKNHYISNNGVYLNDFSNSIHQYDHRINLVYIGSLEKWAGLQIAIKGISLLIKRGVDIYLEIYGAGPYEHNLKIMTNNLGLNNYIKFKGRVEHYLIPNILNKFKIGIITFEKSHLTEVAHPIKLIEYMATGLVVIGSNFGEIKDAITESKAGETVDDETQFANKLESILKDNYICETYSKNAKQYAMKFDWEKIFKEEILFIQNSSAKTDINMFPIKFDQYISNFNEIFQTNMKFRIQDMFYDLESEWIKNKCTRIGIFGAGDHTQRLLKKIKFKNCTIVGLIDSSSTLIGKTVGGHKIFSFNDMISEGVNAIIISSRAFERDIYESIKEQCNTNNIRIYKMYEDNKGFEDLIWRELYL